MPKKHTKNRETAVLACLQGNGRLPPIEKLLVIDGAADDRGEGRVLFAGATVPPVEFNMKNSKLIQDYVLEKCRDRTQMQFQKTIAAGKPILSILCLPVAHSEHSQHSCCPF